MEAPILTDEDEEDAQLGTDVAALEDDEQLLPTVPPPRPPSRGKAKIGGVEFYKAVVAVGSSAVEQTDRNNDRALTADTFQTTVVFSVCDYRDGKTLKPGVNITSLSAHISAALGPGGAHHHGAVQVNSQILAHEQQGASTEALRAHTALSKASDKGSFRQL